MSPQEEGRLDAHVRGCDPCRAEIEAWSELGNRLRRLPDPPPPPALVARTRAAVERWQAGREERAWNRAALGFLIVFGWTLTGVAWLLLEVVVGELAVRLDRPLGPTVAWFVAYLVAGWVMAATAAVLLGRRASEEGRFA